MVDCTYEYIYPFSTPYFPNPYHTIQSLNCIFASILLISISLILTLAGPCDCWPQNVAGGVVPQIWAQASQALHTLFSHLEPLDQQETMPWLVCWMKRCMKQSQDSKLRLSYISQQPANCQTCVCSWAKFRTFLPSPVKIFQSI